MNTRIDHSEYLIHFTKDQKKWKYQETYDIFCKIISEGILKESNYLRLGNIPSICFTEASYAALTSKGNLNTKYFERYSPFGFMFTKKDIYSRGGLPAIYSPKYHFDADKDNEHTNWRTVTFDPVGNTGPYRDFTWEREWRIKPLDTFIKLDPKFVKLVFPSLEWAEKFRDDHDAEHQLESCECNCTRDCQIINYDRLLDTEESHSIDGTCEEPTEFPWILINMNCNNIPLPK